MFTNPSLWTIFEIFHIFSDFVWFFMNFNWFSFIFIDFWCDTTVWEATVWEATIWEATLYTSITLGHFWDSSTFLRFWLICNDVWMILIDLLIFKMKFRLMVFFSTLFTNRSLRTIFLTFYIFADFDWFVMSLDGFSSIFQFPKWNFVWCFSFKLCLQIDHFGHFLWFFSFLRFVLIVNDLWIILIDFLIFKMKFLLMLFF